MKFNLKSVLVCVTLLLSLMCTFGVAAQNVNSVQKKKSASFNFKDIPFGKPSEQIIPWMLNYGGYALVKGKVISMTIEEFPCEVIQKVPFENGYQQGFSINIHANGDWKALSKNFKKITNACSRGKAKRTNFVTSDTTLFANYESPDYIMTIEGTQKSDNGGMIVIDYRDNANQSEFKSANMCEAVSVVNVKDISVSLNCNAVKTDIGKYFKLYVYLSNSTNDAIEFFPEQIEVITNGVKSVTLPVLSKADMLKKVGERKETIKKTYQAFHDSDVRASMASRGMYQVSKQYNIPELENIGIIRADIECNYLQNFNLGPNNAIYGVVFIPYEDCGSLNFVVPIGNQEFNFTWNLVDKI